MAPLTLADKYDDLVRCADQPISAYEKLSHDDLDDVIGNVWPFVIESITYNLQQTNASIGGVRTKLERRLNIQFQLYSEAARRHHQTFPNRRPQRSNQFSNGNKIHPQTRSVSFVNSDKANIETNVPDFYLFCPPKISHTRQSSTGWHQTDYDRVRKYLLTTPQISPCRMLILKQALKECCRCGNYDHLRNLSSAAEISLERFHFDNYDSVLHEAIKSDNQSLIASLVRNKFNVNINGELGTPLVTAIHCNNHSATELLLNHEADLTRRHIDWPYLTLYEYCIEFNRIDAKSLIDRRISLMLKRREFHRIQKLIDDGWTMFLRKIIGTKCARVR